MLTRRIVCIGAETDPQLCFWQEIASSLDAEVIRLSISTFKTCWTIVSSNSYTALQLTFPRRMDIKLDDAATCWYIRLPSVTDENCRTTLALLHSFLTIHAFPLGNYFYGGFEEATYGSKPFQLQSLLHFVPFTRLVNVVDRMSGANLPIIKSMSLQRSTVVNALDSRLNITPHRRADIPVQLQRRIEGASAKVHFYRTRDHEWLALTVIASVHDNAIDYRESRDVSLRFEQTSPEMFDVADEIYQKIQCAFFDVDYIHTEGRPVFLEVNMSPAPCAFVTKGDSHAAVFSFLVLYDWLGTREI